MNWLLIGLVLAIAWAVASFVVFKMETSHVRVDDAYFPYKADGIIFGTLEQILVPLFCGITFAYQSASGGYLYALSWYPFVGVGVFGVVYFVCSIGLSFTHNAGKLEEVVEDISYRLEGFYSLPEKAWLQLVALHSLVKSKKKKGE
ncbi:MAG: hypothetical protein K2W82_17770 [Candidatus Obscuribacterales bacterium]|nr:hypothetical protein [Candidatus Obscuribacterales bacterium]